MLDQPLDKNADKAAKDSAKQEEAAAEDKGVSNEDAPAPAVSELSAGHRRADAERSRSRAR